MPIVLIGSDLSEQPYINVKLNLMIVNRLKKVSTLLFLLSFAITSTRGCMDISERCLKFLNDLLTSGVVYKFLRVTTMQMSY